MNSIIKKRLELKSKYDVLMKPYLEKLNILNIEYNNDLLNIQKECVHKNSEGNSSIELINLYDSEDYYNCYLCEKQWTIKEYNKEFRL